VTCNYLMDSRRTQHNGVEILSTPLPFHTVLVDSI
jgi:hypothetical protein